MSSCSFALFSFWTRCMACGLLVPQPGTEPMPPTVERPYHQGHPQPHRLCTAKLHLSSRPASGQLAYIATWWLEHRSFFLTTKCTPKMSIHFPLSLCTKQQMPFQVVTFLNINIWDLYFLFKYNNFLTFLFHDFSLSFNSVTIMCLGVKSFHVYSSWSLLRFLDV